jgi:hypothetical protein
VAAGAVDAVQASVQIEFLRVQWLAAASLANPKPPAWLCVLLADHPTITQRIARADAWAGRQR